MGYYTILIAAIGEDPIEEVQTDAVLSMMRPQPSNDRQEASEWEGNLPVHPSFGSLLRLPWLATPGGGS